MELNGPRWCVGAVGVRVLVLVAAAGLLWGGCSGARAADDKNRGLPDYREEVEILVGTPASSHSLMAGVFNPAAWGAAGSNGFFVSLMDRATLCGDAKDWKFILTDRQMAFAMQRFQMIGTDGNWEHQDEYTIGFFGGNPRRTRGISYSWSNGAKALRERHRRITTGSVSRWNQLSLGWATTFDVEVKDYSMQADIGVYPCGPRLALFADAAYRYQEEFEDITTGYGVELRPLECLFLAGKLRDDGNYSVRLELALQSKFRASGRMHMNADNDHLATTYTIGSVGSSWARGVR